MQKDNVFYEIFILQQVYQLQASIQQAEFCSTSTLSIAQDSSAILIQSSQSYDFLIFHATCVSTTQDNNILIYLMSLHCISVMNISMIFILHYFCLLHISLFATNYFCSLYITVQASFMSFSFLVVDSENAVFFSKLASV